MERRQARGDFKSNGRSTKRKLSRRTSIERRGGMHRLIIIHLLILAGGLIVSRLRGLSLTHR
jgi:hypothetical protein